MKRSLIALTGLLLVVVLAGTAQAKGAMIDGAQMGGPGLKDGVTFGDPTGSGGTHSDGDVNLLARDTKLSETLFDGDQISPPAKAALGVRYTIVWTMRRETGSHRTFQVRSDLYPYAKGGIVIHTHGGQTVQEGNSSFTLRGGWASANPVLGENLRAWGLPKVHGPSVPSGPVTTTAPPLWTIPVGLLALILVAGFRVKRRTATAPTA